MSAPQSAVTESQLSSLPEASPSAGVWYRAIVSVSGLFSLRATKSIDYVTVDVNTVVGKKHITLEA